MSFQQISILQRGTVQEETATTHWLDKELQAAGSFCGSWEQDRRHQESTLAVCTSQNLIVVVHGMALHECFQSNYWPVVWDPLQFSAVNPSHFKVCLLGWFWEEAGDFNFMQCLLYPRKASPQVFKCKHVNNAAVSDKHHPHFLCYRKWF